MITVIDSNGQVVPTRMPVFEYHGGLRGLRTRRTHLSPRALDAEGYDPETALLDCAVAMEVCSAELALRGTITYAELSCNFGHIQLPIGYALTILADSSIQQLVCAHHSEEDHRYPHLRICRRARRAAALLLSVAGVTDHMLEQENRRIDYSPTRDL